MRIIIAARTSKCDLDIQSSKISTKHYQNNCLNFKFYSLRSRVRVKDNAILKTTVHIQINSKIRLKQKRKLLQSCTFPQNVYLD